MVRQKFVINPLEKPANSSYDIRESSGNVRSFFTRLLNRNTVTQLQTEADGQSDQERTLASVQLLALGIGGIIGTGIFVLSGEAAAKYAGPSVIISFIIAAFVAGLAAFSYAEMASMVPISGSAYSYTYASMLKFVFV